MTRRERLEARAERRRAWAESRQRDAAAAQEKVHAIADRIPFGQPILVGHHSERGHRRDIARIENGMSSAVENWKMAERHEQKAEGLERQLRTSIFSDDADAVEQLEAKAARLEARRERIKAFNKAVRAKGVGPAEAETIAHDLLTEREREELRGLYRINFAGGRSGLEFPAYVLSNLGAEVRRCRDRIARIQRDNANKVAGVRVGGRVMQSRYPGECPDCGQPINRGDTITWYRSTREAVHVECPKEG